MKIKTLFIITVFLLIFSLTAGSLASQPNLRDLAGHWSEKDVIQAAQQGWVNGYPDNTFKPKASISRAEFVKMLESAVGLKPNSDTEKFLVESSGYTDDWNKKFVDINNHWVKIQGWMKPALAFGLIIPSDYYGKKFEPNKAITRQEMAVIIVRTLGKVYPASLKKGASLSFRDNTQIPEWARGFIYEASSAGIVGGYPDGSFGGKRTATRAEAVVMVKRALKWLHAGEDKEIKVFVRKPIELYPQSKPENVNLVVPAQVIDNRIYVPVRLVYQTAVEKLYPNSQSRINFRWNPEKQLLWFEYGVSHDFQAGNDRYGYYTGLHQNSPKLPGQSRITNGELMIPVYDINNNDFQLNGGKISWDGAAKILTIPLSEPYAPIS